MGFIQAPFTLHHRISTKTCPRAARGTFATARLPSPIGDRILVRRDESESTSSGGLVLTGDTEKCHTGEVIAVGNGRYSPHGIVEVMPVQPGDHVFWKDEYGAEQVEGEEDILILRAFSITAKM